MNKQEIIDKLNAQGVTFDPTSNKADLEALLKSSSVPPGEAAGLVPAADGAPAADKPVESATDPITEFLAERETLPEAEIIDKVRAGLSREQAVEVIHNQREHDGLAPLSAAELNEARDDSGDVGEAEIIDKMRAGLTRPQAIEVIHNQRAHDKARTA